MRLRALAVLNLNEAIMDAGPLKLEALLRAQTAIQHDYRNIVCWRAPATRSALDDLHGCWCLAIIYSTECYTYFG
jgi:hypothetical protein